MTRFAAFGRAARPLLGALIGAALVGGAALMWRLGARAEDGGEARGDREHPIVTAPRIAVRDGHTLVRLDEAALRRAAVRVQTVRREAIAQTAGALATVLDLQPLLDLSLAVRGAGARAAAADARLGMSRAAYERAQSLFDGQQNVSAAQLQAARAAFEADRAALAEARSQLDGARAAARLHWGSALADALWASDKKGAALTDDLLAHRQVLLQVTLLSDIGAEAAPELGRVAFEGREGPAVHRVGPAAYADPRFGAGRSYLYRALPDAALLPGASVAVQLQTGRRIEAARVPASAVVWWQGQAWIYLRSRAGDFERRPIAADQGRGDATLLADLPAGSEVVVQGAQVLLSEELRAENSSTDVGGR